MALQQSIIHWKPSTKSYESQWVLVKNRIGGLKGPYVVEKSV